MKTSELREASVLSEAELREQHRVTVSGLHVSLQFHYDEKVVKKRAIRCNLCSDVALMADLLI